MCVCQQSPYQVSSYTLTSSSLVYICLPFVKSHVGNTFILLACMYATEQYSE